MARYNRSFMLPIMLIVQDLYFDYQDQAILRNVNFSVNGGELLHVKGENGSGKTTLLRLLAGLMEPWQGQIKYDGQPITEHPAFYQHNIAYVGHKHGLHPLLTVKENCFYHHGWQKTRFYELLNSFSLKEQVDIPFYRLSAGQKRRAALLRLCMSKARLWLLDEPLTALDNNTVLLFATIMHEHCATGGLIVLTSHQDLPLSANIREYHL